MAKRPATFEQAVVGLNAAVTEAFNRGDVKACAGFYAERALLLLPDLEPKRGQVAIESALAEYAKSVMKLSLIDLLDVGSSGDKAYCAGTYQFVAPATNGPPAREKGADS